MWPTPRAKKNVQKCPTINNDDERLKYDENRRCIAMENVYKIVITKKYKIRLTNSCVGTFRIVFYYAIREVLVYYSRIIQQIGQIINIHKIAVYIVEKRFLFFVILSRLTVINRRAHIYWKNHRCSNVRQGLCIHRMIYFIVHGVRNKFTHTLKTKITRIYLYD